MERPQIQLQLKFQLDNYDNICILGACSDGIYRFTLSDNKTIDNIEFLIKGDISGFLNKIK